jgi:dephospho-CoA kinase
MLIALTGGIGSGKSTVAKRWVTLGATEIDADILARKVVEPGSRGLNQVVELFGTSVLHEDGSLNRSQLAQIAFSSDKNRTALQRILHPLIQSRAQEKIAGISGIIVYTIPLFVETNSPLSFDHVVTISAPEPVRISRLVSSRNMTVEDVQARIGAQATDKEREAVADTVIDSDCSLAELQIRADAVYASFAK